MNENDLKKYTVILGGGSGILFQPVDSDKTYILSAKHIFYDKVENDRGISKSVLKKTIDLSFSDVQNSAEMLEVKWEENYFEHPNIDAAILKIDKKENIEEILIDENCTAFNECILCGYPRNLRINQNDKYSTYNISHKIDITGNGYLRLQANFGTLSHNDISGFSGGGIFRENNNSIILVGIQSSTTTDSANGQIDIIPLRWFKEIVEKYDLPELRPVFLSNFKFLQEKSFDFSAGIDDDDISYTRLFLKQKTAEVISSNITPQFIKDYFMDRLLVNDSDILKLNDDLIYVTWLEFLTLINIVKDKICNVNDLEDVFCTLRLLYRRTANDWLDTDFLKDCLVSNYDGLAENGTVFIKTSNLPSKQNIKHYKLDRGSIVPRIDSLKNNFENGTLNSDVNNITNALSELKEFVFDKYNFVHFEYLKHFMLVENSEDYRSYKKSNEKELLIKLKEEYGKIFRI